MLFYNIPETKKKLFLVPFLKIVNLDKKALLYEAKDWIPLFLIANTLDL